MFRCNYCGAEFEQPAEHIYRENLDGERGWYTWHMAVCPECGDEQIDLIESEEMNDGNEEERNSGDQTA